MELILIGLALLALTVLDRPASRLRRRQAKF